MVVINKIPMVIQRTDEEKEFVKRVGRNIKEARRKKHLTQKELAELLGYKLNESVSLIENGKVASIDLILLHRIKEILKVSITHLLR